MWTQKSIGQFLEIIACANWTMYVGEVGPGCKINNTYIIVFGFRKVEMILYSRLNSPLLNNLMVGYPPEICGVPVSLSPFIVCFTINFRQDEFTFQSLCSLSQYYERILLILESAHLGANCWQYPHHGA